METDRTALADAERAEGADQRVELVRWTCTTGSNARSRGAVVVQSGDHRWQASAEGIGPVDALYRAVDSALHDVLTGHPRLTAYDLEALTLGTEGVARVRLQLSPPEAAEGARSSGTYEGIGESPNIVAASIEAYIDAVNGLLAEEHWAGATDSAGNFRAATGEQAPSPEYDPSKGAPDTTRWWT
jgi:2-isopropylmalate synthase